MFNTIIKDLCSNSGDNYFINEIAIGAQQVMRRYIKARDYLPLAKLLAEKEESISVPEAKVSL